MRKALFITLDNTLITTKSGREFPLHSEDWKFKLTCIEAVKEYVYKGYMICIISNQSRISLGFISEASFKYKLDTIIETLKTDLNITRNIFITKYCKYIESYNFLPRPGMIYQLALEYELDLKNSVLIGNALYDKDITNFINITYIDISNLNY